MEIIFIGQGLDTDSNNNTGQHLLDSFQSNSYKSFYAFVAFVSSSGLNNIIEQINQFKQEGGDIRLYIGINLNGTTKEALEILLANEIETYIVYSPNNIIYHPKVYAFEGTEKTRAIIGSSNLTASGLFQNVEASVQVDFLNEDEGGQSFLADIYDHFNTIISNEHDSCQLLTSDLLQILLDSKLVLSETVAREKINLINREFGQKDTKTNAQIKELFGTLKSKRPPKGFKKAVRIQEFVERRGDDEAVHVNVVTETAILSAGAMWIETGKMTGGSRNILDLSKKGKLNGELKFGSVTYFGLEPDNTGDSIDINIHYGGKNYQNNHIFYTQGNNNWRIRLNGETEEGDKLTTFSKPSFGENGGFQDKILIFNKLDNTNYELAIVEKDEMEKLIENSVDWARGGNETTGRAYGILR